MGKNCAKWGIFCLVLAGSLACAGRQYQNMNSTMAAIKSKRVNVNPVVSLQTFPVKFTRKAKRTLASSPKKNYLHDKIPSNNKKFYFLTLYQQFNHLKKFLPPEKASSMVIKHCPSFHSCLLDHRASFKRTQTGGRRTPASYPKNARATYYPELSLPVSPKGSSVIDLLPEKSHREIGELVDKALQLHTHKTHQELLDLCNSGYSDNYYTYANLSNHAIKEGRGLAPSTQNMKLLFKTTLFSNWALLKSLDGKITTENFPYHQALAYKFKIFWVEDYFKSMIDQRKR